MTIGRKMHCVLTCCLFLTLFQQILCADWINVNVGKNEWPGINKWLGKNLCDSNQKACTTDFADFVKSRIHASSIHAGCEWQSDSSNHIVCWVRQRSYNAGTASKRTVYEVQFWSDNSTSSHCQYREP
ncbi:hypothetical protein WDU94_006532 [Cyamophila willieti]